MNRIVPALLTVLLAACSSMQPVSVRDLQGQESPTEIQMGDRVEVLTHDNEKFEFAVTEISALGLGGRFGFIPYERMRRLRVQRPGAGEHDFTWLWVLLGTAAAFAVISAADSVTVCSPGPCPPTEP